MSYSTEYENGPQPATPTAGQYIPCKDPQQIGRAIPYERTAREELDDLINQISDVLFKLRELSDTLPRKLPYQADQALKRIISLYANTVACKL